MSGLRDQMDQTAEDRRGFATRVGGDRIEVGPYMLRDSSGDYPPLNLLVVSVNGADRIVARRRHITDEDYFKVRDLALADPNEAKVMWELAGGGPR